MNIALINSTNNNKIDQILCGIIGIFESVFQNKISGYYVEGSYSDKTSIATSDIDLTIMFYKLENAEEQEIAYDLAKHCSEISSIELDVEVTDEKKILQNVTPNFKLGSFLVYGKDIRDTLPLIPIDDWTRERMHISYWQIINIFKRSIPVTLPLRLPKPNEEFYGYTQRKLKLADGQEADCTRDLIRVIGWSATALIALKAGRYVVRKKDCHIIYREIIGDEWSDLLEDIYEKCRNDWNYLIPTDYKEQKKLKDICKRALEFENYFIKVYMGFLLSELQNSSMNRKIRAICLLGQVPLLNETIKSTLCKMKNENNDYKLLLELENTLKVMEKVETIY